MPHDPVTSSVVPSVRGPVLGEPMVVDDVEDARLDAFRNLKGQARRADGTFVAESELVLDRLVDSGLHIRAVLVTPARLARVQAVLATADSAAVAVFVATQATIDAVVGYPLHRGVIALAERPPPPDVSALLARSRTLVVLEGVMDPDNVGAVFRHGAGFGIDSVLLLGPCGDPLYRKTIRTSMGWSLEIPYGVVDDPGPDLVARLHDGGFLTLALTPNPAAEVLASVLGEIDRTAKVAFLVGAEGPGLTGATMSAARHRVRIPLAAGVDSLNVASAAAIALYALTAAQPDRLVRAAV